MPNITGSPRRHTPQPLGVITSKVECRWGNWFKVRLRGRGRGRGRVRVRVVVRGTGRDLFPHTHACKVAIGLSGIQFSEGGQRPG